MSRVCAGISPAVRPIGWPECFPPLNLMSSMDSPIRGNGLACTPLMGSAYNSPVPSPLTVLPMPSNSLNGSSFMEQNFVAAAYPSVTSPQSEFVEMNVGAPPMAPANGGPLPAFLVSSSAAGDFFLPTVPPLSMAGAVAFPGIPGPPAASFYAPGSAMFAPHPSMYSGLPSAFTAPLAMTSCGTPHNLEAESMPCNQQAEMVGSTQAQASGMSAAGCQIGTPHHPDQSSPGASHKQRQGLSHENSPSPAPAGGGEPRPMVPSVGVTVPSNRDSPGRSQDRASLAPRQQRSQCSAAAEVVSASATGLGSAGRSINTTNNNNIRDLLDPKQREDQTSTATSNDGNDDGYVDQIAVTRGVLWLSHVNTFTWICFLACGFFPILVLSPLPTHVHKHLAYLTTIFIRT
ncbi:tsc22 domain family protein 2 [Plakobranchus ocellatus]|uniref:Tsc22 domain family protein 2 n=1 Tax=Plakobranchus ocellatus TaxID=259542 RepID=A0AAV3Z3M5_9GAST|nr:tsc22 domain family protein 2 [Plakobranchus ocellatus]